jgi:hypothetical protein
MLCHFVAMLHLLSGRELHPPVSRDELHPPGPPASQHTDVGCGAGKAGEREDSASSMRRSRTASSCT